MKPVDFDDLERHLRDWRSSKEGSDYDFVGMFHLFRACILNLAENATPEDLAEAVDLLGDEERKLLLDLAAHLGAKAPPFR